MLASSGKVSNPKTLFNYIYAIISSTIVLYLLGILGILMVYASNISTHFKESIPFTIELKDDANEAEIFKYQKQLEASDFVKPGTVKYISKAEGAELLKEDLGEDDLLLFGENPLPDIIQFRMRSEHLDNRDTIIKDIKAQDFVEQAFYVEEAAKNTVSYLHWWSFIALVFTILFIFVAVTLVKNTLKLIIFSNRHSIQTMQLMGATWDFMTKPYLRQSIKNGLLSSGVAILVLILTLTLTHRQVEGLEQFESSLAFSFLFIGLALAGILLWWGSTMHSVRKYLTKPIEEWEL